MIPLRARGAARRRALVALLALALLPSASLLAAAAAQDCAAAQARLSDAWRASGETLSPEVAEAARAVVRACPREPDGWTWTQGAEPQQLQVQLTAQGLLAMRCGFRDKSSGSFPDAPILGTIQYLGKTRTERDHGPATLTYDPSTNATEYTVAGTNWTLHATNANFGHIVVRGVIFPIVLENGVTQAGGGCGTIPSPTLCWGYGYGQARIGSIAISASSNVHQC